MVGLRMVRPGDTQWCLKGQYWVIVVLWQKPVLHAYIIPTCSVCFLFFSIFFFFFLREREGGVGWEILSKIIGVCVILVLLRITCICPCDVTVSTFIFLGKCYIKYELALYDRIKYWRSLPDSLSTVQYITKLKNCAYYKCSLRKFIIFRLV